MDLLSFPTLGHFYMVFEISGRNFTAVPRKTYTGSGRSIRLPGHAGDDAIGGR